MATMNRLEESLTGNEANYIFPFFWQHGEEEKTLREYMRVIHNANIHAVCVESRPHPDFAGPKWWRDMDIILEEARKLKMRVWILDDSHFPTGYAAGAVKTAPQELTHLYMVYRTIEMSGPSCHLELELDEYIQMEPTDDMLKCKKCDAQLVKVLACPVEEGEKLGKPLDLTNLIQKVRKKTNGGGQEYGTLIFDLPEGYFRIFVIYLTRKARGRNDYINFMDKESCRLLVDAVYEPHFKHYKEYFGNVIAGFFSDEPPVGNTEGYLPAGPIGTPHQNLPWSRLAAERFSREFGSEEWMIYLPYLWAEATDCELQAKVRCAYMEMVTKLIAECFSDQIGGWCHEHGVEYIGHMLEDCDINSDLGISMGHYFRGLSGQDMGGIDNIGGQVMINGEYAPRHPNSICRDEAGFYHYLLGKLGASHAAIDPKKKGRCMCENFGAYGWQIGTKELKFMMDHFMVRGVNRFVPHAFSPAPFPDPDCPPHFYAHGENPLYRAFSELMAYTNRVCHLIDSGIPLPDIALLYNGESKWAGNGDSNIPAARALTQAQVDFHVIPSDVFDEGSGYPLYFDGKILRVNKIPYQALIISGCDFLGTRVADFVRKAACTNYPVIFLDHRPIGIIGATHKENMAFSSEICGFQTIPAKEIGLYCRRNLETQVVFEPEERKLVSYHYISEQEEFLLLNENAGKKYTGTAYFRTESDREPHRLLRWYPWENRLEKVAFNWNADKCISMDLELFPLELCVMIPEYDILTKEQYLASPRKRTNEYTEIIEFTVKCVEAKNYAYYSYEKNNEIYAADNMNAKTVTAPFAGMQEIYPEYSGFYIYETSLFLEPGCGYYLVIEELYESAEVFLNDKSLGMKLQKPFIFELTEAAEQIDNILRIEIATTLERKVKAMGGDIHSMSACRPLLPTGITGRVCLYKK